MIIAAVGSRLAAGAATSRAPRMPANDELDDLAYHDGSLAPLLVDVASAS
jgi:hypothetical protein